MTKACLASSHAAQMKTLSASKMPSDALKEVGVGPDVQLGSSLHQPLLSHGPPNETFDAYRPNDPNTGRHILKISHRP